MTAKKKPAPAPKLKLRVGGVYVDGDGNECHIVSANPYTDHYGMRYQDSGRCESDWRAHDLIREVGAPKPKAAKPVMAWVVWTDGKFSGDIQWKRAEAKRYAHLSGAKTVKRVEVRR